MPHLWKCSRQCLEKKVALPLVLSGQIVDRLSGWSYLVFKIHSDPNQCYDFMIIVFRVRLYPNMTESICMLFFINEYVFFLHGYAFTSYFMQMEASSKFG